MEPKFKIGDHVRIVAGYEGYEFPWWNSTMDYLLGAVGVVTEIDNDPSCEIAYVVTTGLGDAFWMQSKSLRLVSEENSTSIASSSYQALAQVTDLKEYTPFQDRAHNPRIAQLTHAHLGLSSETGEIGDALKKHIAYGKPLDVENLIEELGDLMWYVACACNALDVSLDEVQRRNIEKLQKRYPEGFSEYHASLRLDKENNPSPNETQPQGE